MIICTIDCCKRYLGLLPQLDTALIWLAEHHAADTMQGSVIISQTADGIIAANYETPTLRPRDQADLECHKHHIDIHIPLKATETIGWTPVSSLHHPRGEYDKVKDIAFYGDSAHSMIHVNVGQMAIFFPEDAHAPNIGLGNHKKICIKIPL